jgi:hypothetical protein
VNNYFVEKISDLLLITLLLVLCKPLVFLTIRENKRELSASTGEKK